MAAEFYDLNADTTGPRHPLIGDERALMRAALIVCGVLAAWKLYIACITHVLWDEAHFVMSGQYLALGYPDIPAGYPWLARLITTTAGWSVLPLRLVALVIGTAIPWAVWWMAKPVTSPRSAVWAAIVAMFVPAVTQNGAIFYPEGGLQLLLALMAGCLIRAMDKNEMKWWLLTGLTGALGMFVHFRFCIAGLGVLIFLAANPVGREQWRKPGLYAAGAVAALGLLPSVIYNAQNDWPAVQYHILNRPKFAFYPDYVLSFLSTQIAIVTPLFFFAMAMAAKALFTTRRRDSAAVLAWLSATLLAFYCVQALFNKRVMPHWPWMAFLPLIPCVPDILIAFVDRAATSASRRWREVIVASGPVMCMIIALAITAMQVTIAHSQQLPYMFNSVYVAKTEDWALAEPDLAAASARARQRFGADVPWATNGHTSAVHLEFPAVKGRRVYTLDEPYDMESRFSVERAMWGLGSQDLMKKENGKGVLLILNEPTYVYHEAAESVFYKDLCNNFSEVERFKVTTLPPGRLALDLYTARVGGPAPGVPDVQPNAPCPFVPQVYIARPTRGEFRVRDDKGHFFGMAADPIGIKSVDIYLDDVFVTHTRYGLDPDGARAPDLLAYDPNYPKVQYDFDFPPGTLKPGKHMLKAVATRSDGTTISSDPRILYVK